MKNTGNKTLFNWRFSVQAFSVFFILLTIEVLIALFVHDSFIRPYLGDVIVVILMYYFLKIFIKTKPLALIIPVLLFAYIIEILQHFHLVEMLGVEDNIVLRTILGSSFSWGDFVCYTIGAVVCFIIEKAGYKCRAGKN